MSAVDEIREHINMLLQDASISKSIKLVLESIREELREDKDLELKIDSALQKIEDLGLDPNISPYVRTQVWNLTTLLESAQSKSK